jgi:hypothetical protein
MYTLETASVSSAEKNYLLYQIIKSSIFVTFHMKEEPAETK